MVRLNSKGQVQHPAKFSRNIINEIQFLIRCEAERLGETPMYIFDPMGGVGGIFDIHEDHYIDEYNITCIEIEEEWAEIAASRAGEQDHVQHADFFEWAMEYPPMEWNVCATSVTYGNRMADNHTPGPDDLSTRNTYRHVLERPLTAGSSAGMQWGDEYREFHQNMVREVYRLLMPTGMFILNIKDHIRKGQRQPVARWFKNICKTEGFMLEREWKVPVRGNRQGENGQVRVDHEMIYVFRRPAMQLDRKALKWTQPRLTGPA